MDSIGYITFSLLMNLTYVIGLILTFIFGFFLHKIGTLEDKLESLEKDLNKLNPKEK